MNPKHPTAIDTNEPLEAGEIDTTPVIEGAPRLNRKARRALASIARKVEFRGKNVRAIMEHKEQEMNGRGAGINTAKGTRRGRSW